MNKYPHGDGNSFAYGYRVIGVLSMPDRLVIFFFYSERTSVFFVVVFFVFVFVFFRDGIS